MPKVKVTLVSFLLSFCYFSINAQSLTPHYDTVITANTRGYYSYLPLGYNPNTAQTYPLIISLHGQGELGDGSTSDLPDVLSNGIPRLINHGQFPTSFTSGNQDFSFIVIAPQFVNWPQPSDVNTVVNMAISEYKVNINRIYITGLSMGGGATWEFAGNSPAYANRIAAIVPVAGASWPEPSRADIISDAGIAVWATHNDDDPTVPASYTIDYVNQINNHSPAPTIPARATIFSGSSHDAWTHTYDPGFTENGLNVYEWMLQYQRNFTVLPVTLSEYRVYKSGPAKATISWSTSEEINNHHFTIERSGDGIIYVEIGSVNALNMPGNYSFTDDQPQPGTNYYRLSQTDINGTVKYFNVQILHFEPGSKMVFSITPNPVTGPLQIKLESEETGQIRFRLINSSGKILKKWTSVKNDFVYTGQLETYNLLPGLYFIELKGRSFDRIKSFIKN